RHLRTSGFVTRRRGPRPRKQGCRGGLLVLFGGFGRFVRLEVLTPRVRFGEPELESTEPAFLPNDLQSLIATHSFKDPYGNTGLEREPTNHQAAEALQLVDLGRALRRCIVRQSLYRDIDACAGVRRQCRRPQIHPIVGSGYVEKLRLLRNRQPPGVVLRQGNQGSAVLRSRVACPGPQAPAVPHEFTCYRDRSFKPPER